MKFLLAAPASGSGKTAVTCGFLAALSKKGTNPCAFKCGPDYIDPMFHRSVLKVESHNLDLFLSQETVLQNMFARYSAGHGAVVCEGVMGMYDGVGGSTTQASAWDVASRLSLPILLVVRPKGASLTLAAQINGLRSFREDSRIKGLFLNDCSPMLYKSLKPMLEKETGLPVVGYLPHLEEAVFESRHLGLTTAEEITDLRQRVDVLGNTLLETVDFSLMAQLFGNTVPSENTKAVSEKEEKVTIAVAKDKAFSFVYAETLDAFRDAGAKLVFFSPLEDASLPEDAAGLYLPGGYPELYASTLSENKSLLACIREKIRSGMPTVAECGGFLYLGKSLQDREGAVYPMAGVLPGEGFSTKKLVRFGYASITAPEDSLLFAKGDTVPFHEFHYWDSTANGEALQAKKPATGKTWRFGFAGPTLYAGFPHLYFAGFPKMAKRFVEKAAIYQKTRTR